MHNSKGLNVDAFGVDVRIEFGDTFPEELSDRVRVAWSGARLPDGASEVTITPTDTNADSLLEWLSTRVTLDALKHRRGDLLMFHAAGIAAPDGRVVAFVGPSGRGKTTLSRTLGKHYAYVSDETISVSDDLTVHPYRKPLSLKRDGKPKQQVSPAEAGLGELPETPLRLTRLVILDRDKGAEHPRFELLPLHEAVDELLSQSSYLVHLERPLQRVASLCERVGGIVRLSYCEATTIPEIAEALFEFESEMPPWCAAFDGPAEAPQEEGDETRLVVGEVLDAIETEEHLILMTEDGMLRVLSGVGPELWNAARRGLTLPETVEAVVQRYGAPPEQDPVEILEPIIDDLVEAKIVRRA